MFLFCVSQHDSQGGKIIERMYEQWHNKWPKTMAFEQNVIIYNDDETIEKKEVWQEILHSPSNLHIRFNGFESGNGMIFSRDSVFYFEKGKLTNSHPIVHYLLLMAFDVYFLPIEETIEKLTILEFDLYKTSHRLVDGKKHYVIGTDNPHDEKSNHFVVDAENLWLTEMTIIRAGIIRKISLKSYQLLQNYPVATEIFFYTDGRISMYEHYFNITFPQSVNMDIFDKEHFEKAVW
jgi:hypothetical protein